MFLRASEPERDGVFVRYGRVLIESHVEEGGEVCSQGEGQADGDGNVQACGCPDVLEHVGEESTAVRLEVGASDKDMAQGIRSSAELAWVRRFASRELSLLPAVWALVED